MATLFFSYCHKDEVLRDELEVHLATLKRQGLLNLWHDRKIMAGDNINGQIDQNIEKADVILALISADFINSDYCHDVEMRRAMERHRMQQCRLIPVILRPCEWKPLFGEFLAAPTDGKPVTRWTDKDEALLDVVSKIRAALPQKTAESVPEVPAINLNPRQVQPRSSNLRIRREFTEADRDQFLDDAFEYMAVFFEETLKEFESRHEEIKTRFKRLDAVSFGVTIYKQGKPVAQCGIRNGGMMGAGITYVNDATAPKNSMNEVLRVQVGDQALALTSGFSMRGTSAEPVSLTFESAAEYFWAILIQPLQS